MEKEIIEQFVPYELTLKLKDLGFDEKCFAFYQEEYAEKIPVMVDDEYEYSITSFRTYKNSEIHTQYTGALLWQQAFDWFTKNFDLYANIERTYTTGIYIYEYFIDKNNQEFGFSSYGEARLACLKKLIEFAESGEQWK